MATDTNTEAISSTSRRSLQGNLVRAVRTQPIEDAGVVADAIEALEVRLEELEEDIAREERVGPRLVLRRSRGGAAVGSG